MLEVDSEFLSNVSEDLYAFLQGKLNLTSTWSSRALDGVNPMKRVAFFSLPTTLAALFGCTSSLGWYAACGCAEEWTGVVGDVGAYWADMKPEDVTPRFLAEKTLARLQGQSLSLETVRGVGQFFDASCARVLLEIRCTFWLWAKGDELRGIELQFVEEDSKVGGVIGQYVYGKRGGSRD